MFQNVNEPYIINDVTKHPFFTNIIDPDNCFFETIPKTRYWNGWRKGMFISFKSFVLFKLFKNIDKRFNKE